MHSTLFIGIDPGQSGGIAAIGISGYETIPMPETRKQAFDYLHKITFPAQRTVAVVEKVASRPGQGVASMFKFGKGYGELLGILTALHCEILEPTPQAWKKIMLAGTDKGKDASIQVAENLFPDINFVLPMCRKAHDGMCEAILLAEYGRRVCKS
jgi:crossover junction endodeoxyribonuclease RuvC